MGRRLSKFQEGGEHLSKYTQIKFISTRETKLQSFQYRIIHRTITIQWYPGWVRTTANWLNGKLQIYLGLYFELQKSHSANK